MLVVGVTDAETAAEVVGLEGAELGDRFDRGGQLLDVEQLRADVGVYSVECKHRAALDARDRFTRVVGQQPEFGAGVPGGLRGMGGGFDSGDHPHQTVLPLSPRHDAFQPVDVVEIVDDHQSEAVLDGQLELFVRLGVAVHDQPGGIGAGLDGGEDLAAAGHIEVQTLFDHHPLNRGARE